MLNRFESGSTSGQMATPVTGRGMAFGLAAGIGWLIPIAIVYLALTRG